MKSRNLKFIIVLFTALITLNATAQQKVYNGLVNTGTNRPAKPAHIQSKDTADEHTNRKEKSYPEFELRNGSFFKRFKDESLNVDDALNQMNDWLGLNEDHSFVKIKEEDDEQGMTHLTYRHFYKGIEVDYSTVNIHLKEEKVQSVNGRIIEFTEVPTVEAIDSAEAVSIAKSHLGVTELIQSYPVEQVIYRVPTERGLETGQMMKVRIDSYEPFEMCYVYINVENREPVNKINLYAHADVAGNANTFYSGNQPIVCDQFWNGYRLRESGRNIETYDATLSTGLTQSGFTGAQDYVNYSNNWGSVLMLNTFTVSNISTNWWSGTSPDLYFTLVDGSNETVYMSRRIENAQLPETWQQINIPLTNPPYTIELWEGSPQGSNNFGGSHTLASSQGTTSWSVNGNSGSVNLSVNGHPAYDVHWGIEKSYDYYSNIHNRNSYDGNGSVMKSFFNPPTLQFQNGSHPGNAAAYPDPYNFMIYGTGDGEHLGPVVELDVCAHEMSHLVIDHTSGLVYQGESGALNESFADIFGASTAFEYGTNPNWEVGEQVGLTFPNIRNMADPNTRNNPHTYNGNYWWDPNDLSFDNGGVHINSGVQNYWFYLLCEGGSGTNDNNDFYSVSPIGRSAAEQIAYRNLTVYLNPNSSYIDAYNGSLQATADLYGNPSPQYTAVEDAWYAVGITSNTQPPSTGTCDAMTTLTSSSGLFSDGSGSSDYQNNTDCSWLIQPSGATEITLSFIAFHTEANYDFVTIYDGPDESSPQLAQYSGNINPQSVTSSQGSMLVKFTGDASITAPGWLAQYSSQTGTTGYCSGTTHLTAASGSFSDGSGAHNNYENNTDCRWLINPPGATQVHLDFSSFNTESGFDYVTVYDGPDDNANVLAQLSGSINPNTISTSAGNGTMYVKFTSDGSVTRPGWNAYYSSDNIQQGCSGTTTLTASSGTFNDGTAPHQNYENNTDCRWLISPPGANRLSLEFIRFETEANFDEVTVYDGPDETHPSLGTYSGNSIPPLIFGSQGVGEMYVVFTSDFSVTATGWEATYTTVSCNTTTATLNENACNSFTLLGETFDQSGTYTLSTVNSAGCDSVITLNLTITAINNTVSVGGQSMMANGNNLGYQWINCSTGEPVDGETDQFFTPSASGTYAVEVSSSTCTDTSECHEVIISGISENTHQNALNIYPNPNNGTFTVASDFNNPVEAVITDASGRVIRSAQRINTGRNIIELQNISSGVYFFRYQTDDQVVTEKLIIR